MENCVFNRVIQFNKAYFCCLSHPCATIFFVDFCVVHAPATVRNYFVVCKLRCYIRILGRFFIILGGNRISICCFLLLSICQESKNPFFIEKEHIIFRKNDLSLQRSEISIAIFTQCHFFSFQFLSISDSLWRIDDILLG